MSGIARCSCCEKGKVIRYCESLCVATLACVCLKLQKSRVSSSICHLACSWLSQWDLHNCAALRWWWKALLLAGTGYLFLLLSGQPKPSQTEFCSRETSLSLRISLEIISFEMTVSSAWQHARYVRILPIAFLLSFPHKHASIRLHRRVSFHW